MSNEPQLIPVEIIALVEEENGQSPIIVLYDKQTNRILPIWIGDTEARAIAILLNRIPAPRPLTHQLLLNTVKAMGGQVLQIVVDRLQDTTYFATIYINQGGNIVTIDARPSDSIALSLQANAPILVEKSIMDIASQINIFPLPLEPRVYKQQQEGPRKIQLSKQDLERLSDMLKKAREREQQS